MGGAPLSPIHTSVLSVCSRPTSTLGGLCRSKTIYSEVSPLPRSTIFSYLQLLFLVSGFPTIATSYPMLFFLKSSISFLLFVFKSLSLKPLFSWANEVRLLLDLFWRELLGLPVLGDSLLRSPPTMSPKKKSPLKVENVEESGELSILDLPDLVLECILGKLSPVGLCSMAPVCRSLRERCWSDHLWERHMREKWSRVVGPAAHREWQWFTAVRGDPGVLDGGKSKGLIGYLSCMWPISWLRSKFDWGRKPKSSLPVDSMMSWYLALDSGKFWFPAQVYNREHGHVGFMLSCYDAELSYDCRTDTFHARYPPHGQRTIVIEEGIQWERIRVPPIDTLAHDLHPSDCLNDLCPRDHIEIQWRRNKEFPYENLKQGVDCIVGKGVIGDGWMDHVATEQEPSAAASAAYQ
ncbi:hypothetical protein ACLOJK_024828 [Asimina triloba]